MEEIIIVIKDKGQNGLVSAEIKIVKSVTFNEVDAGEVGKIIASNLSSIFGSNEK